MVGTVQFNLDPHDGRAANAEATTDVALRVPPEDEQELEAGAALTAAPRLPFAPDPGSYTQRNFGLPNLPRQPPKQKQKTTWSRTSKPTRTLLQNYNNLQSKRPF